MLRRARASLPLRPHTLLASSSPKALVPACCCAPEEKAVSVSGSAAPSCVRRYAAALSEKLKDDKPLEVELLGRKVVLFRDMDTGARAHPASLLLPLSFCSHVLLKPSSSPVVLRAQASCCLAACNLSCMLEFFDSACSSFLTVSAYSSSC